MTVKGTTYREAVAAFATLDHGVLARFAAHQAILLGKDESWNGGDVCESLAIDLTTITKLAKLPAVSDQSDEGLEFWRAAAEELGWEHDGPEDDDGDE